VATKTKRRNFFVSTHHISQRRQSRREGIFRSHRAHARRGGVAIWNKIYSKIHSIEGLKPYSGKELDRIGQLVPYLIARNCKLKNRLWKLLYTDSKQNVCKITQAREVPKTAKRGFDSLYPLHFNRKWGIFLRRSL